MVRISPTVRRKRLGFELQRLRDAAGLTGDQVAKSMEWAAASKTYRMEKGEIGVQAADLRALIELYGVTDPELVEALKQLAREGRQRGWWAPYNDVLNRNYATYIGLEAGASELRCYEALVFQGLIQTEAYARALFQAYSPNVLTPGIDRKVALRMDRQARIGGPDPLRLVMVVDESVILRRVGGKQVMYEQLTHIKGLIESEAISFRVIPLTVGAHPGMTPSFTYIHFEDERDPDCVYVEGLAGDTYIEGDHVEAYRLAFEAVRSAALDAVASLELIQQAIYDNEALN